MKPGDKVEITLAPENYTFFKVGDRAILKHQDSSGDWWADFGGESEFCIQDGISACKIVKKGGCKMNKGDKVTTFDGSYAIKLDAHDWAHQFIAESKREGEEFTVIGFTYLELRTKHTEGPLHDVVIRSNKTGETYLHSTKFLRVVESPKCPCCGKEITK